MVKNKKTMEEHYDDCGDDLSSISEVETTASIPAEKAFYEFDTDDELSDDDHNFCMMVECGPLNLYPVDVSKVAKAQTGSTPAPGRDPRAAPPATSTCKGCRHYRPRNDLGAHPRGRTMLIPI